MKRLAFLGLALASLSSACTGGTVQVPLPSGVLSPAPRTCPMGIFRVHTIESKAVPSAFRHHLPVGLPSRFGLALAGSDGTSSFATWSDRRCEQINISFVLGSATEPDRSVGRVGAWTVEYNEPEQCGNQVLGTGGCIGYTTGTPDGAIYVQFIGLTRAEADRIVQSIPLATT